MAGKRLVCPICGAIFTSNAALYDHINSHASEDEKRKNQIKDNAVSDYQRLKMIFDDFINEIDNFNEAYADDGYEVWINLDDKLVLETPDDDTDCSNCEGKDGVICGCSKEAEADAFANFLKSFVEDPKENFIKVEKPKEVDYGNIFKDICAVFDNGKEMNEKSVEEEILKQFEASGVKSEEEFADNLAKEAFKELIRQFKTSEEKIADNSVSEAFNELMKLIFEQDNELVKLIFEEDN